MITETDLVHIDLPNIPDECGIVVLAYLRKVGVPRTLGATAHNVGWNAGLVKDALSRLISYGMVVMVPGVRTASRSPEYQACGTDKSRLSEGI